MDEDLSNLVAKLTSSAGPEVTDHGAAAINAVATLFAELVQAQRRTNQLLAELVTQRQLKG